MSVSRYYDVKRDAEGKRYLEPYVRGFQLMHIPLLNKGTAFTGDERERLGLQGLLAPHVSTLEEQVERLYARYRLIPEPLEQHNFLRLLQDRNEVLFYAMLERHLEAMLPIIYTPTVGEAVRQFSNIYRYPRGLTVSSETISKVDAALGNVPLDDVRMIVATDSSAILGIGDQGFGGMAIAIGKLSIYTVAGGVGPDKTLPIELDVGTDREELLNDPFYLGTRLRRLKGEAYFHFLDRFVEAVINRYPKTVIQWEDFAKDTAFAVLNRYRKLAPSFNDDIQGTGAVALAGVLCACRLKNEGLQDQRIVIHGAGAGGAGVAWAVIQGLKRAGLSESEAQARVFVLDSRGLLLTNRTLEAYKQPYAHLPESLGGWTFAGDAPNLLETVQEARATILLGLSGQAGSFSQEVTQAMLANAERPVIFPLSNPTANSEALPEELFQWTAGRAIVAAGSPFEPVEYGGAHPPVGQGNNAFVFPGLGLGVILSRAREITDAMVLEAAYALAEYTETHHPERVYPPIGELREVSMQVAAQVMAKAIERVSPPSSRFGGWTGTASSILLVRASGVRATCLFMNV